VKKYEENAQNLKKHPLTVSYGYLEGVGGPQEMAENRRDREGKRRRKTTTRIGKERDSSRKKKNWVRQPSSLGSAETEAISVKKYSTGKGCKVRKRVINKHGRKHFRGPLHTLRVKPGAENEPRRDA